MHTDKKQIYKVMRVMGMLPWLWESFHDVYRYEIIMLYPLNIFQFCQLYLSKAENEKEWNIDTRCNVDEPQSHYTKWRKPDTKDYILLNPEIKHRMVVDRGLEGEGIGRNRLMDRYFTLEWCKCFGTRRRWGFYNIVIVLNATEWFTPKWFFLCYVNLIFVSYF